jgi:quercetin dioxygenase-like cupin family protein
MKAIVIVRLALLSGFSTVAVVQSSSQTTVPKGVKTDSSRFTIANCVNEFSPDNVEKTKAGYQYWFVNKDLADGKTLKMSVVGPQSSTHPPHAHPEDEFFFVLEGKVEFYLAGERKVVGPYASLYCPSSVEHGIRNVGTTEAKYLVVKKYEKNSKR